MISESTDIVDPRIQHNRTRTCPECGSHNIHRSTNMLAEIHSDSVIIDNSNTTDISGKYCAEDNCSWFEMDRAESTSRETSSKTTSESPIARDNGRVKLGDGNAVSIFHENVTLLGDKATYLAENRCPKCASDVEIILKRTTPEDNGNVDTSTNQANEAYHPIVEKCVNYGMIGNGCDYKRD